MMGHLDSYYTENSTIPLNRRPNVIHVAGKYAIMRIVGGMTVQNADGSVQPVEIGKFHIFITNPDIQAIVWVLNELQRLANASTHIIFRYDEITNRINTT